MVGEREARPSERGYSESCPNHSSNTWIERLWKVALPPAPLLRRVTGMHRVGKGHLPWGGEGGPGAARVLPGGEQAEGPAQEGGGEPCNSHSGTRGRWPPLALGPGPATLGWPGQEHLLQRPIRTPP